MWLRWTHDDFGTTFTTQLSVSTGMVQTMDSYQATIPAQPAGTTVRFDFDGTAWDGSTHIVNPGAGNRYTYVTQ